MAATGSALGSDRPGFKLQPSRLLQSPGAAAPSWSLKGDSDGEHLTGLRGLFLGSR